jgi:hypothetical protein
MLVFPILINPTKQYSISTVPRNCCLSPPSSTQPILVRIPSNDYVVYLTHKDASKPLLSTFDSAPVGVVAIGRCPWSRQDLWEICGAVAQDLQYRCTHSGFEISFWCFSRVQANWFKTFFCFFWDGRFGGSVTWMVYGLGFEPWPYISINACQTFSHVDRRPMRFH